MGLFDFFKHSGEDLVENVDNNEEVDQEAIDSAMEGAIAASITELGLAIVDLGVSVSDGIVTLTGEAPDQETLEKTVLAAGNVVGISTVDCQLEVSEDADDGAEAEFYTVEKGDTLSKIAKKVYGDASEYMTIFEANQPMLEDPDEIYPGQTLRIPALDEGYEDEDEDEA
jgi:nucleoid-associated protein YgaU